MIEVAMTMPKMGESVIEATILQWFKNEGDHVTEDESLLEVATDKVDSEIPATHTGLIKKILAPAGKVVAVGKPIAILVMETTMAATPPQVIATNNTATAKAAKTLKPNATSPSIVQKQLPIHEPGGRFYSPLVRCIAKKENISRQELTQIPGTGKDNRITKRDLMAYLGYRKRPHHIPAHTLTNLSPAPGDEIVPMDRVRKMIAERMVSSIHTAPHVTSFIEADVTDLVDWRNKHKAAFGREIGVALTYTVLFVEAITRAIQAFPMINIAVVENNIIKKKAINIGLAVALPNGNLIVPVIKNANQLSFRALAKNIQSLVYRARNHQLNPDDLADGTYTVSNIGSFGNLMGTPIIMQPQVAILALGAITKQPSVIETPEGDTIAIRYKMFLSHTYDHRVIDGALGGMFVKKVADELSNFDVNKIW